MATSDRNQVLESLAAHGQELRTRYSVRRIGLFGSVARGDAGSDSDIDILVDFEPDAHIGLFGFARLQLRLSELLGRPVDLVTADALHEALRDLILEETVYAA